MYYHKERTIRLMKENNLDVLVTACPTNVSYFTGFPLPHGCMADVQAWAVVPCKDGAEPILIAPVNAVDLVAQACYVDDVRTWGKFYVYETEGMDWSSATEEERRFKAALAKEAIAEDAFSAVLRTLGDLGLTDGVIGLDELGLINPPSLEQFSAKLPRAKVVPARGIIGRIRAVKTPMEIAVLRQAALINQTGIQALLDYARPWMTEIELHQVYLATVRKAGAESHHACIQSGTRGALPTGEPSTNVLRVGDGVRMDFDLVYNRYYADMARTAVVGRPSADQERYAKAVISGLECCKEIMRPGIKASEVFHTAMDVIRKNGIPDFQRHHIGHGIGLACYDQPLLSPKNDMVLEAGMVINIETPYYKLGFGASHFEETMLITADGAECLQTMPLDLKIIPL